MKPVAPVKDIRQRILAEAKTLLRRHGVAKLKVVDIAKALAMSHANIYRYFNSKAEILDAINDEWLSSMEAFVEEIARRPGTAAGRLESVVVELHARRRQKFIEDAEVFETFRRLVEVRPEMLAVRREKILAVFRRLFAEGVKAGEFPTLNIEEAAIVLKDATATFLHPFMIPITHGEDTLTRARQVVRCILGGFAAAGRAA